MPGEPEKYKVRTKHAVLVKLNEVFARDLTIEPVDAYAADKRLSHTRTDVPFEVRGYDAMLDDMRSWVGDHPALYPHYQALLSQAPDPLQPTS